LPAELSARASWTKPAEYSSLCCHIALTNSSEGCAEGTTCSKPSPLVSVVRGTRSSGERAGERGVIRKAKPRTADKARPSNYRPAKCRRL
jgi:hypothetical protein